MRLERAAQDLEVAIALFPDRPDARYHLARTLHFLGRTDASLDELNHIVESDPTFEPAKALRAAIYEQRGESDPVTERSDTGSESDGAWTRAMRAMARGSWTEAESAYSQINDGRIEEETHLGSSLEILMGRAVARMEGRRFDEAERDFKTAATLSGLVPIPVE